MFGNNPNPPFDFDEMVNSLVGGESANICIECGQPFVGDERRYEGLTPGTMLHGECVDRLAERMDMLDRGVHVQYRDGSSQMVGGRDPYSIAAQMFGELGVGNPNVSFEDIEENAPDAINRAIGQLGEEPKTLYRVGNSGPNSSWVFADNEEEACDIFFRNTSTRRRENVRICHVCDPDDFADTDINEVFVKGMACISMEGATTSGLDIMRMLQTGERPQRNVRKYWTVTDNGQRLKG